MDCPFCNTNKEKTRVIQEKEKVFVCLSSPRLMFGHLLVVPKRHVEKLSELRKEEKDELFETVIDFQEKILSKIAGGCDIRQNYRPFQVQDDVKVNHLHIHLQPREFEDELYQKSQIFERKYIFKPLTEDEITRFLQLWQ